ncbi:glycosyltransferase [Cytobacillus gottheilii]|uniref:glycosyltransferase n=1 Tax=Cytobacillus gottheilii TaxID=859144 RepID=UPI000832A53E|nr:glycosyltransferase [Cytobacillus gottheilii]
MEKILMVVDHLGANGTITHVISLSKALQARGYHIIIAGREGSKLSALQQYAIPFYPIDFPATFTPTAGQKHKTEQKLKDIIQAEGITMVHAHQVYSGMIAARISAALNIRFLYTVHGLYSHDHELKHIAGYSEKLIAVSPYVYSQLISQYPEKLLLILNGIDETEFFPDYSESFKSVHEIPLDHFVIFYASRLEWIKADICLQLIQAVNQLKNTTMPDLQLVIAGEGKKIHQLNDAARQYNLNRKETFIRTIGSQTNLRAYYGMSDCIIGTGRTALEALLCEKKVIAAGNKGFFGAVKVENWEEAKMAHFGDHFAVQANGKDLLIQSLIDLRNEEFTEVQLLREVVIRDYSIGHAAQLHIEAYS